VTEIAFLSLLARVAGQFLLRVSGYGCAYRDFKYKNPLDRHCVVGM
jgi:hypothetical protein